jgi:hypothetical protein
MAGLINLRLLTDFFNKIGPKRFCIPAARDIVNFGTLVFRVQCGNDFPAIHIKVLAAVLKAVLG